jgi:competence ComEA-like helix-hairpin-helix protein
VSYADASAYNSFIALQSNDSTDGNNDSISMFYFDPNTITTDDWVRLGLSLKQAEVIEKYKSRGGKFRKPDDLRKIYVLSDDMKNKLVPYVKIKYAPDEIDKENAGPMYTIEINTADSAAFESLYGIGPYRAARIIKYRNQLGGFYKIEQIGETRGLPDSVFQMIRPQLKVDPKHITQIDINSADYMTLSKHPYIHKKLAAAIIDYRNFNGRFESPDEIRKLKPVTDEIYKRISPYLKAGE